MKSVNIRNVSPETLDRLKHLARMHNRSLQGELHVILAHAAAMAPLAQETESLNLITVDAGGTSTWRREEIYGSDGR